MSTSTTTTEERQRLQQRYERLLRERATASLMGEAAATAAAEAHEARHGVGTNPTWYPPSLLQASTQRNPLVINPARIEAAIAELSDPRNINLTPRPAHQPAAALRGARAHSGVAAPSPPAAASPAACRQREFQPLDLSRQPSQQWRPIGPSGTAVAGPTQVYGPQAAGTPTGISVAYAPIGRASAAYAQAGGSSATYSQVPRPFAMYGPVAGPSAQPQPAGRTATLPHVAGHSPTYKPAEREAHLTQMEDRRIQASSFETYQDAGPNSFVYSEQESTTSTLRRVYYTPQMASTPSHSCPLGIAGSSQGPTPLVGYPPMMPSSEGSAPQAVYPPMMPSSEGAIPQAVFPPMMPSSEGAIPQAGFPPMMLSSERAAPQAGYPTMMLSSEGAVPQAGYPPMMPSSEGAIPRAGFPPMMLSSEGAVPQAGYPPMMPSSEGSTPQAGYPPMVPSSEGATIRAGYIPVVSFSAGPSQVQMAPHYGYGVPHPTSGYQQTWPAISIYQQAAVSQGHQAGPSRSRPTKRAVPFSGRHTPFQQPRYLRPAAEFDSPIEAGTSAGQAPSQGPLKATVQASTLSVKSEPVKFGGGKRESIPVVRILPIEVKQDDQVSGIPIKKVPGEKMIVRRDVARGRDEAGTESKAETNPEANTDKVADVDREGDADPVADTEREELEDGERQFDVEEYEPLSDDGECEEESSSSDGESGQQAEVPTCKQQVRVPPQAPWAAVGGAGALAAPRPSSCSECARLATPGLRCVTCRWRPMPGEVPTTTLRQDYHSLLFVAAGGSCPLLPVSVCFTVPVVDTRYRYRPRRPSAARGLGPADARGSAPESATPAGAGSVTSTVTGSASAGRKRSTSAEESGIPRRSVITAGRPSAQIRTSDSRVQVAVISESEYESHSADGGEEMEEEDDEAEDEEEEEAGEEEEFDEEQEEEEDNDNEEEEDNDNEDQQESADEAVEKRGNPHDIAQQETAQSTSASPEAREDDEEVKQSGEEVER